MRCLAEDLSQFDYPEGQYPSAPKYNTQTTPYFAIMPALPVQERAGLHLAAATPEAVISCQSRSKRSLW
jgi:hypothetical protein